MSQTRPLDKRLHCLLGKPTKRLSWSQIYPRILIELLQTGSRNPHSTRGRSSDVFVEEGADIAQVHCESELFEFQLSNCPPCGNVKGNLRRYLEFWRRIGTPNFIVNVIERGYTLPFVGFSGTGRFHKQQILSFPR